jgi:hypothetical protein
MLGQIYLMIKGLRSLGLIRKHMKLEIAKYPKSEVISFHYWNRMHVIHHKEKGRLDYWTRRA